MSRLRLYDESLPEQRIAVHEMALAIARDDFRAFAELFWPVMNPSRAFVWSKHMDAIAEHLVAITKKQIKRLIINIPPGHSKTGLVNLWIAWELASAGHFRYIVASYSDDLSKKSAQDRNSVLQHPSYGALVALKATPARPSWTLTQANTKSISTSFGGWVLPTSVGGQGTGRHGDRVIVDDPIKASDIYTVNLQRHVEWFKQTLLTRRTDAEKTAFLVVMQRLHGIDLSGELMKASGTTHEWTHLKLQAMFVPGSPTNTTSIGWKDWRTEPGQLLCPERFSKDFLEEQRSPLGLGPVGFAAQYQQEPVATDGNVFAREWWRFWSDEPNASSEERLPKDFNEIIGSWDMTYKGTKDNDFVVGQIWARSGPNFYLLDQVRGHLNFTATTALFRKFAGKWSGVRRWLIEEKANGAAIIESLKVDITGLIPIVPGETKEARAQAISPFVQAGNVFVPSMKMVHPQTGGERYPWVVTYLDEMTVFPMGEFDDQVDCSSQAINDLAHRMRRTQKWEKGAVKEDSVQSDPRRKQPQAFPIEDRAASVEAALLRAQRVLTRAMKRGELPPGLPSHKWKPKED